MRSTSSKRSHGYPFRGPRGTFQGDAKNTEHLAVLEALNLPVSLIDRQYTYRWVNSCYGAAQGKKPGEIIGKTVRAIRGEVFDKAIKSRLDRCLEGVEVRSEAWINYPALGPRYCEIVYSPYCPDGENAISAIVVADDITDRKEMEKRLIQSEQRFRDLSDASLEAIVFIEDGVIVDANKALDRLFGYEEHELRGRRATDFITPDGRTFADQRIQARTEGRYETLGLRRDGRLFPIEINSREVRTNGRSLRIAAIRDLTKHKEMEQRLKAHEEHLERLVEERTEELGKSEKKFRNIFENATEGIFQITPEGHFLSINPAFASIHGYDSPEDFLTNVNDIEQLHVEPERRREYVALLHKKGLARSCEFKMYCKDGTITWTSVNARSVCDETGVVLYQEGTVRDISQRKRAEEQLLVQRNLALDLAATSSPEKALSLCLETAIQVSDMDCGALHLKNPDTHDLEMAVHIGLSEELAKRFSLIKAHSEIWSLATQRRNVAFSLAEHVTEAVRPYVLKDGIRSAIMAPVFYKGQVIASMNLGSHKIDPARNPGWPTLELIAGQLGNIIVRIQAEQELQKDIEKRKKVEEALEAKSHSLEEANTGFKVLLKHREEDMKELEERFVSNVKRLVLPLVEKLKKDKIEPSQRITVDCIEAKLKEILSPFLNNLRRFNFTPRQLEIAVLIKEGRTTKDIAELLHVGKEAVDLQRFLIRKKLGLNKEKADLRSYLLSIT
jgi:PAS domain S-box-containing protein